MSLRTNLEIPRNWRKGIGIGAPLSALAVLAGQRKSWSPLTILGVLWRIACNPLEHRRVIALRWNPIYTEHLKRDPRFLFKYLTHDYLARNLSVGDRARCFVHHYRRLYAEFSDGSLRRILSGELRLLDLSRAGERIEITLGLSKPWDKEGELSLSLRVDGQLAYSLAFSVVPGAAVGAELPDAILIARLQGERGAFAVVARATRALHDVMPAGVLVAVLEGVAQELGIGVIASVSGKNQTSYRKYFDRDFQTAYDGFFAAMGVEQNAAGFFLAPVPWPEKPLSAIKRGHRLRTKNKREFKRGVTEQTRLVLRNWRRLRMVELPYFTKNPFTPAARCTQGD